MSERHTPAPWTVPHFAVDHCKCDCRYVLGEHGGMGSICTITVDNGLPISEGGNDGPDLEQAKANAHLIAAAPEMLAALKAADAHFAGTFSENGTDHQQIRAAIAKAEAQSDV